MRRAVQRRDAADGGAQRARTRFLPRGGGRRVPPSAALLVLARWLGLYPSHREVLEIDEPLSMLFCCAGPPRWHAISPLVRQRVKHTRAALQLSELGLCPRLLAAPPIAQNGVGRLCRLAVVIGQLSAGQGQLHLKEHILRHEKRAHAACRGLHMTHTSQPYVLPADSTHTTVSLQCQLPGTSRL